MHKNTYTTKVTSINTAVIAAVIVLVVGFSTLIYPIKVSHAESNSNTANGKTLTGFCYSDYNYADPGSPVTWSADAEGGTGQYSYSWVGTEGLRGSTKDVRVSYDEVGYKIAGVRISSGGQTINVNCYYPLEVGKVREAGSVVPNASALFTSNASSNNSSYGSNTGNTGSRNSANPQVIIAQGNNPVRVPATNPVTVPSVPKAKTNTTTKAAVGNSNSTDINKAVTALRTKGYNVELPDSAGNSSMAAAIFSLNKVPWTALIVVVIFILFAAILYQMMGKKA